MEDKPHRSRVWIVVLVIVGLLGSFVVGGLAGGVAGYMLGRRSTARIMVEAMPWSAQPPQNAEPQQPYYDLMQGARITQVIADSPAERAGLQVGDVIVSVDDQTVSAEQDLADLLAAYDPGDTVSLAVLPVGETALKSDVKVTLGRNPDKGGETAWLGIEYVSAGTGLRFRYYQPGRAQPDNGRD